MDVGHKLANGHTELFLQSKKKLHFTLSLSLSLSLSLPPSLPPSLCPSFSIFLYLLLHRHPLHLLHSPSLPNSIPNVHVLTGIRSTSERNRELTDIRASCGHSWNQSILVQLTMAGNFRLLTLRVVPTGEKHSTTFSCLRTLSIKNDQQFSLVSCKPALFTSFLTPLMMLSYSSPAKRSGISPEANRSLINTRNFSSGTWASVRRNTVPIFLSPALI